MSRMDMQRSPVELLHRRAERRGPCPPTGRMRQMRLQLRADRGGHGCCGCGAGLAALDLSQCKFAKPELEMPEQRYARFACCDQVSQVSEFSSRADPPCSRWLKYWLQLAHSIWIVLLTGNRVDATCN